MEKMLVYRMASTADDGVRMRFRIIAWWVNRQPRSRSRHCLAKRRPFLCNFYWRRPPAGTGCKRRGDTAQKWTEREALSTRFNRYPTARGDAMKTRIGFFALTLLLLGATPSFAQWWSGVGMHAGGSAALLRGNDVGITDDATDRSLGFTIGLYKSVPLGAGFAIQPELMYTQKGGTLSFDDMIDEETNAEFDLTFNVDYLEVPVALTYTIPIQSRYLPTLYAGPYMSLVTRRDATFDAEGASLSIDGDEFFKRIDYGAVFGADLGFRLKQRIATLGVRYDLGLADIAKDGQFSDEDDIAVGSDIRTDEWSVLIGFRL